MPEISKQRHFPFHPTSTPANDANQTIMEDAIPSSSAMRENTLCGRTQCTMENKEKSAQYSELSAQEKLPPLTPSRRFWEIDRIDEYTPIKH
jgi:hypothetical protein